LKAFPSEVLQLFKDMKMDRLDLHVLFESGGNDPAERKRVLDGIDELLGEAWWRMSAATSIR
jgi:hypothetical protein